MKAIKATLIFNDAELIEPLKKQVGNDLYIIDAACTVPVEGAHMRLQKNLYWAQNWHQFLMQTDADLVWMLNPDVENMSNNWFDNAVAVFFNKGDFMITPSFNSPHQIFHHQNTWAAHRQVNWVDMTAPIIDVHKYRELGGFDPIFKGYFADVDLCYRARQKGWKMWVDYWHSFHHIGGYTVSKNGTWEQSNAGDAELLCKKWGVNHWTELCQ